MLTRSLDKARDAYLKKDVQAAKDAHSSMHPHEHHLEQGKYLKSIVYGGLDGTITTFAVVAGVAGASLSAGIVLIVGFANLLADGLSMAVGDYLSTKAEQEYHQTEREREQWEVENHPDGEKQEMIELYQKKGFSKKDASAMVSILSKNKKAFVDVMMVEELSILESDESPLKNAIATFISFVCFGFVPLIIYILALYMPKLLPSSFVIASLLTGGTLFVLGAVKTKITQKNLFVAGFEMLLIGGIAAAVAYFVGYVLGGIA